ncbi:MAG: hypothetical protein QM617_08260 [Comamonas sp.]
MKPSPQHRRPPAPQETSESARRNGLTVAVAAVLPVTVLAALAAVLTMAWLPASQAAPAARETAGGPLLRQIATRGEVVIGVRAYRRPSPDPETRAEPDEYDLALARHLAGQLGARLRTVALTPGDDGASTAPTAGIDLALGLAGPADAATARSSARGAADTRGGVVILPRPARQGQPDVLAGTTLCVNAGSPYAATLAKQHGARIKTLPSAIAALSAFSAFECDGVAADARLLDRLQVAPDWAYYQRLPLVLEPAFGDQARLAPAADSRDTQAVTALLEAWTGSPQGRQQRDQRLALQTLEATLLEPGSYCH